MKKNKNLYNWYPKTTMQRIRFYLAYTLVLAAITVGCDDFVQVEIPQNQLIAQEVFEESATANAAMTDVYSKMRDAGILTGTSSGISCLIGNYADELTFYGGAQSHVQSFYDNSVLPLNSTVKNVWNSSYNQIYAVNAVVEGVSRAIKLPKAEKKQLKGEALLVRALLHFYLSNLFGPVPYIKTTDYKVNSRVPRNTVAEVYQLAALDLENAIELLEAEYKTEDRTRPNKFVAYALLARVKLYEGAWIEAANAASAVLNETGTYTFETNLDKIFLKGSTTTLWQFNPKKLGLNTNEGITFIFLNGPPSVSALTESLLNAFEPGDLRKTKWTRTVTNGTNSWTHPYKYKQRAATSTTVENSVILRTSEVYLIRAEARARAGELIGAKEDLNKIRNNAGLANTTAVTSQEILTAIHKERRVELFTEFGHRFFDLKREGKTNEVLGATKVGWTTAALLLPLPQDQLDLNPALEPQNQGY